jgi:hypothetical protein
MQGSTVLVSALHFQVKNVTNSNNSCNSYFLTVATSILALVSLGISQMKCSSSSPAHRGISCQQEITLSAQQQQQQRLR